MNQKTQTFKGFWRAFALPLVSCSATLLIAFALSFVVVGCSRKGGGGLVPGGGSGGGNGISFRAVSSGSSATKTVYGGPEKTVGNVEPIYWSNGDILTIACAQARSSEGAVLTSADYELVPTASDASKAMIYPVNNGNGLWWGTVNPHHFYSLYPSKAMMDAAYKSLVDVATNGTVKGVFPASQNPIGTPSSSTASGITTVTLSPDMRYGYLWSGVDAAPKSSSVSMTFKPLFTAFEFVVGGDAVGGDLTLKSFELSSSTCALSGNFTAQIAEGGGSVSLSSVPARTTSNNTLSLTFPIGSNAVVVSSTKQARFTVLTFAGRNLSGTIDEKISDLTIKFTFDHYGTTLTRSLLLKKKSETTAMVFDGRKKYRIKNLTLPALEATFTVEVIDYDAVNSDLGFGNVTVGDMSETDGDNLDFS